MWLSADITLVAMPFLTSGGRVGRVAGPLYL
jgi:hypothetical protein